MKIKSLRGAFKDKEDLLSKEKIFKTILVIGLALLGSFLMHFIMQIALDTRAPMLVVVSDSMEPALNEGDLIFVRGIDPEHIKAGSINDKNGDIIVFDAHGLWEGAPDGLIVHRVVDRYKKDGRWHFLTKGDANWHVDFAWVPEGRILGKVIGKIPYIGWVKIVLVDWGLIIPLIISLVVINVIDVIKEAKDKNLEEEENLKNKKKKDL